MTPEEFYSIANEDVNVMDFDDFEGLVFDPEINEMIEDWDTSIFNC